VAGPHHRIRNKDFIYNRKNKTWEIISGKYRTLVDTRVSKIKAYCIITKHRAIEEGYESVPVDSEEEVKSSWRFWNTFLDYSPTWRPAAWSVGKKRNTFKDIYFIKPIECEAKKMRKEDTTEEILQELGSTKIPYKEEDNDESMYALHGGEWEYNKKSRRWKYVGDKKYLRKYESIRKRHEKLVEEHDALKKEYAGLDKDFRELAEMYVDTECLYQRTKEELNRKTLPKDKPDEYDKRVYDHNRDLMVSCPHCKVKLNAGDENEEVYQCYCCKKNIGWSDTYGWLIVGEERGILARGTPSVLVPYPRAAI